MQRTEIFNHYKDNFNKNLPNDRLLDWESREAQFARFKILKDVMVLNGLSGQSLLDVGCGTADLYDYLTDSGITVNYTGVDILPEMTEAARKQHPDLNLVCADIFKDNVFHNKFDIVYSSGIFNIDLGNNYEFLPQAILRFVSLSDKYVVFNLLADTSLDKESGYFYFNKSKVEEILQNLGISNRQIITGYLHNDMSVVITK